MPGMRCAVAICNNSYFKTKERPDGVSYFRFPKDERLRKVWVDRCKRKDKFNPDTSYICSDHFKSDDFVRNIRGEIMGNKKKIIKKEAMPSVKLLPQESEKRDERKDRLKERENKEMVKNILENSQSLNDNSEVSDELNSHAINTVSEENVDYKLEYFKMKENFEKFKNEQYEKNVKLDQEYKSLKKDIAQTVSKEVQHILSGIFSQTQIDLLINKKKRVKAWSCEDITKAFTIRYLSKRCCIHLRSKMGIPLPSMTTLKEWASKLSVNSGVLDGVLNLMQVASVTMNSLEKLVVLQFDEMKVMSLLEYDLVNDKVMGPHSQAQVIMVRSLFASWKQPIFTEFDQKMTKSCLGIIIAKLYAIGFTVVAVVSDCGGGNVGVWKDFNVSYNNSLHLSNITNRNIYFFADVPHLLKLIRNWYIDGGFVLADGTIISPEPVRKLVEGSEKLEISSCHKLTPKHVNCDKFQRQNVQLAAQLMSNTTACALQRYDVCDDKLRKNAARFIKSTNNWFDVMNSRVPNTGLNLKCGYGLHLEEQKKALEEYIEIMEGMSCIEKKNHKETSISNKGKKTLKLFQKGVIMSTRSLILLYNDLKIFNISYILTAKLNQDSLENFFSLVRGSGGCNDHPTPIEFLYRMRLLILGKNETLRNNCNTHQTDEEFIVGKVLKKASVSVETVHVAEEESDNDMEVEGEPNYDTEESVVSVVTPQPLDKPGPSSINIPIGERLTTDGLNYISGWMARKLKNKYPDLGEFTYRLNRNDGSWVSELSAGGLTEATSVFQNNIIRMENVFNTFAGENIPNIIGIKQKLKKKLKEVITDIPEEVIDLFSKRRIAMRVKFLNKRRSTLQNMQKYNKLQKLAG